MVLAVAAVAAVVLLVIGSRDDSRGSAGSHRGPGPGRSREGADSAGQRTARAALVTRDRRPITDDQLVHALELGDVVILYDGAQARPGAASRCSGTSRARSTPSWPPPARR